ncbi:MAG: glycerol kinase GlpK [Pseudomonadota bacterium]
MSHILAIDQGTTSARAIVYDTSLKPLAAAQEELPQIYPADGWVEHDAEIIWKLVQSTVKGALSKAGITPSDVAAIGITNQRETVVLWDKATGKTIGNAIVWQDRRTAGRCQELKKSGHEGMVQEKTGLLLDPYFSGSKLGWMLEQDDGVRRRSENGDVLFGTIDSFLIWRLTGGQRHVTDATNACRTLLFDLGEQDWSDDLLKLFGVPRAMLPEVLDCAADFGVTDASVFGAAVPILGCAGDQHAATIGQACFEPGMVKATYGTGLFALLNTGEERVPSRNRLLTTLSYRLDGKPTFALEGSVFIAGAAVQWLRDGMQMIESAPDINNLAAKGRRGGVTLVPAFVGLGAPYWDPDARGAMFGLTRDTGPEDLALAVLESVGFQTHDLLDAMGRDWQKGDGGERSVLRVDGGMAHSDLTLQLLSDLLDAEVQRPDDLETTVKGAAYLAGLKAGLVPDLPSFSASWTKDATFTPHIEAETREAHLARWKDAIERTLSKR